METLEAQKSELIHWISSVNDQKIIHEMILLRDKSKIEKKPRKFGDGKYLIAYIAEDFNQPIDHFDEDTRP